MDAATRQDRPLTPRAEDAPQLIEQLRVMMLHRMMDMMAMLPTGAYTDCKIDLATAPGIGTFKLRDFAAALKDLAAIGKTMGAGAGVGASDDVEDWSPLRAMGLFDDGEDDEDEDA